MISMPFAICQALHPVRVVLLFAMSVALFGCRSNDDGASGLMSGSAFGRPNTVWVYMLAATPEELHQDFALSNSLSSHSDPQTEAHIQEGRALSREIANELVAEIRAMGMQAALADQYSVPAVGDVAVKGAIVTINEGNAAERVVVGFGVGASSLSTVVETFQLTPAGWVELGSGTIDSSGSKSPGTALGVAGYVASANPAGLILGSTVKLYGEVSGSSTVEGRAKKTAKEIGTALQTRFRDAGWIR